MREKKKKDKSKRERTINYTWKTLIHAIQPKEVICVLFIDRFKQASNYSVSAASGHDPAFVRLTRRADCWLRFCWCNCVHISKNTGCFSYVCTLWRHAWLRAAERLCERWCVSTVKAPQTTPAERLPAALRVWGVNPGKVVCRVVARRDSTLLSSICCVEGLNLTSQVY